MVHLPMVSCMKSFVSLYVVFLIFFHSGLAPSDSNPNFNVLNQLSTAIGTSDFSLCLGEFGGQLVLGGYDDMYVGSEILWVPNSNIVCPILFLIIQTKSFIEFKLHGRDDRFFARRKGSLGVLVVHYKFSYLHHIAYLSILHLTMYNKRRVWKLYICNYRFWKPIFTATCRSIRCTEVCCPLIAVLNLKSLGRYFNSIFVLHMMTGLLVYVETTTFLMETVLFWTIRMTTPPLYVSTY